MPRRPYNIFRSPASTAVRKEIPIPDDLQKEQDRQISQAVEREGSRLRNFIRKRIAIPADAEDILQDAFYRLVETVRFAQPVERIGPWLYRTARNRIVDFYRRERQAVSTGSPLGGEDDDSGAVLEDLLPSPEPTPEAAYAGALLFDELEAALAELPEEQRFVFVQHEIEGRSYRELAAETGVNLNTLLARKRYAVRHLRRRLGNLHEEFMGR